MAENEKEALDFMKLANSKYELYKKKWKQFCNEKNYEFDEDVFSDTIIKVYEYILKNGLKDKSENGLLNYWFKSFSTNIKREQLYSRNLYRDKNIDATTELDNKENGDEELQNKLKKEVKIDYKLLYLLNLVEEHFDHVTFYCFRLYFLCDKMTYSKLKAITKVQDCKKRVVEAKKWLKENVDEKEINKEFEKWYNEDD